MKSKRHSVSASQRKSICVQNRRCQNQYAHRSRSHVLMMKKVQQNFSIPENLKKVHSFRQEQGDPRPRKWSRGWSARRHSDLAAWQRRSGTRWCDKANKTSFKARYSCIRSQASQLYQIVQLLSPHFLDYKNWQAISQLVACVRISREVSYQQAAAQEQSGMRTQTTQIVTIRK